ncbi:GntR family transcriptional regulator [Amycolatopsis nigrescens]|uniref:GntR family transcriptional regulator n=1 Tax=Amycolatopsis nigrescens TaxID=381445 RepID=UPI00037BE713|nr:GntR family transcriptional regulator [Amycolatopsis nigrescens]
MNRLVTPPSMAVLAADAVRGMILGGELSPGERVVENRLTELLGVSRPPLREALKVLEHEGLVVQHPRRGAVVTPMTQHDVYEIITLRNELEEMAVRLGVPVRDTLLLRPCREALAALEAAAAAGDDGAVTEQGFAFHLAIIGLAGHTRLTAAYRAMSLQLRLCMGMNRSAMRDSETLAGNVERHRALLRAIETGDPATVRAAFAEHGHQNFLAEVVDQLDGATPQSRAWLATLRPGK